MKAFAVYANEYQLLPTERIIERIYEFTGHRLSKGTLHNLSADVSAALEPCVGRTRAQLAAAPVAHFDATGPRVWGKLRWWARKGMAPLKVAAYARVSTSDQNRETQLLALRDFARGQQWEIVGEFVDHAPANDPLYRIVPPGGSSWTTRASVGSRPFGCSSWTGRSAASSTCTTPSRSGRFRAAQPSGQPGRVRVGGAEQAGEGRHGWRAAAG